MGPDFTTDMREFAQQDTAWPFFPKPASPGPSCPEAGVRPGGSPPFVHPFIDLGGGRNDWRPQSPKRQQGVENFVFPLTVGSKNNIIRALCCNRCPLMA